MTHKELVTKALNFKNFLNSISPVIPWALFNIVARKSVNLLILSSTGNSHGLCFPFYYYRKELYKLYGIRCREHISDDLEEKRSMLKKFEGEIVFVSMPLRINGKILSSQQAVEFFSRLALTKRTFKIVFFDCSDSASSQFWGVLPYVDLYLTPFVFRDPLNYQKQFRGGNIVADYLSKRFHIEPTIKNEYWDELFTSEFPVDNADKLLVSWNWVLWRKLVNTFKSQHFVCLGHGSRNIDILCRVNPYSGWCQFHRSQCCKSLNKLIGNYKIVASEKKVDFQSYVSELENSKIMFSPFGYGEICPKDFEAVMKGCLLIKPSVEHLETYPQIHVPYETYVPVKWDLTDLHEKVTFYLENDDERQKLVQQASKVFGEFFSKDGFLVKIKEILLKLGLGSTH
ncbi:MAG: glycosyltransferase family 1 protein [Simkania sp.]|nr:glycosyltransferase family 1 protein [Simkania sp.]